MIFNRIPTPVKDQMEEKYGYTVDIKGHNVNPNKDTRLTCHYLEHFYVLPVIRMDQAFIEVNVTSFSEELWAVEILKGINGLKAQGENKTFHVMIAFGDDFAWIEAKQNFAKWTQVEQQLLKIAEQSGFDAEIFYSTIPNYFEEIAKRNTTIDKYDGDFLPYIEPIQETYTDYWSGYYYTRPNLKNNIRDVFNRMVGVKSLFVTSALSSNENNLNFSEENRSQLREINEKL